MWKRNMSVSAWSRRRSVALPVQSARCGDGGERAEVAFVKRDPKLIEPAFVTDDLQDGGE